MAFVHAFASFFNLQGRMNGLTVFFYKNINSVLYFWFDAFGFNWLCTVLCKNYSWIVKLFCGTERPVGYSSPLGFAE